MIMSSLYFTEEIPFQDVVIYATILAKDGSRMSKSKGNGVNPMDLIAKYGADAMRFNLLTLVTNNQDVQVRRQHRQEDQASSSTARAPSRHMSFVTKIWNASRFVLMNMDGYTPGEPVAETAAGCLDASAAWPRPSKMVTEGLENYSFGDMARDAAELLLERGLRLVHRGLQGRLLDDEGAERLQAQRNLVFVLDTSLRLLHPRHAVCDREPFGIPCPPAVLDENGQGVL